MKIASRLTVFFIILLFVGILGACEPEVVRVDSLETTESHLVVGYSDGSFSEVELPVKEGPRQIAEIGLHDEDRLMIRFSDDTATSFADFDKRGIKDVDFDQDGHLVIAFGDGTTKTLNPVFDYHTVNFLGLDETVHRVKVVRHGESIEAPEPPSLPPEKTFKGWDADLENITSDLNVKPLYDTKTHEVTFETGTFHEFPAMDVPHGETVDVPGIEKEGHELEGLYKDADFTTPFAPEEPIKGPLTIYFNWVEIDHSIYNQELLEKVIGILLGGHYKNLDEEALYRGAIRGVLEATDDPYTTYMTPEEAERFRDSLGEDFVGVGITVENVSDNAVVRKVWSDSPAEAAGMMPGDIITHIDDEDVRDFTFTETILKLLGEKGTEVEIGVHRPSIKDTLFFPMVRAVVASPTAEYDVVEREGRILGYLKINNFGTATPGIVTEALAFFEEGEGIDALIIDVRDNSGGYLGSVRSILDMFLVEDELPMFSVEQILPSGATFSRDYNATGTEKRPYEIATLINENSASAAEVFAAGMMEQGGHPALGNPTFGKGTMQIAHNLDSAGELRVSVGRWFTPEGDWVHRSEGDVDHIEPTIRIERSELLEGYSIILEDGEPLVYDTVSSHNKNAQIVLNALGFEVRKDGYFDAETKAAVESFQSDQGLEVTGEIDTPTATVMNELYLDYRTDIENDNQFQEALEWLVQALS